MEFGKFSDFDKELNFFKMHLATKEEKCHCLN